MPDVQEVFRMATQKVRPEPGFVDRQFREQRRRSRNRKLGALAIVAVIGVAAVVVVIRAVDEGTGTQPGGTPTPTTEMPDRFFLDLGTGSVTPLPEGIPYGTNYAPSPDGTMLATNPCCDSNDPVWISNIDGTGARVLTPDDVDGYGPQWSPDGSMLVYQGRDGATQELGNLFVVDVTSGETTQITNLEPASHGWWFMAPSFSPDGRTIVFHMPRGRGAGTRWDVWTVPVTGGEPTLLVANASTGVYGPDGELAYLDSPRGILHAWSSPRLMVADADGGAPKVLVQGDQIEDPQWSPSGTSIAYADGDEIFVVDVSSGVSTKVADGVVGGGYVEWLGDEALVIGT